MGLLVEVCRRVNQNSHASKCIFPFTKVKGIETLFECYGDSFLACSYIGSTTKAVNVVAGAGGNYEISWH